MRYTQQSAEVIAVKAVEWLVNNEDLLPIFLGASGAGADDLRSGLTDPAFLGSVLDFVLMDDTYVTEFAQFASLEPQDPFMARQALPGGDLPNWT